MSRLKTSLATALILWLPVSGYAQSPLDGDARLILEVEFEGGSARVVETDTENGRVRIMPAGDPDRGWPAWWCFRVSNLVKGQSLSVTVVPSSSLIPAGHPGAGKPLAGDWAMPDRAAWSVDRERWEQTSLGRRVNGEITYELSAAGPDLWIAWGPMATPTITNKWLEQLAAQNSAAETFDLARTHEGRMVRGIRIASGTDPLAARPVVWIQARQHAWESGSSWVARAVAQWLVGDSPEAVWLRENTSTYIIPIMDVDRAATGDGGKEAAPHDHNRDWSDTPYYPEVAAAEDKISGWADDDRMAVFIDLHNPAPGDRKAYFYVAPDEVMNERRKTRRTEFLDAIAAVWDAPIPLDAKTRSTGPSYHPLWHQISATWVTQHTSDETIAVCLETPWNTPHSNTAGYRQVGVSLATGISQFLQRSSSPAGPTANGSAAPEEPASLTDH